MARYRVAVDGRVYEAEERDAEEAARAIAEMIEDDRFNEES